MAIPYTKSHSKSPLFTNRAYSLPSDNHSLVEEYISWKRSYAIPAGERYGVWVRRFQTFANKVPEMLTHHDCIAFAMSLRERFAPKSIQYAMSIIHNYLRFFAEQGRIRFPLYLVRVPRAESESHNAVGEEEYSAMLDVVREQPPKTRTRDMAVLMLLHDTGMRVGELVSLNVDDIEQDMSAVIRSKKSLRMRRVFWNADTDHLVHEMLVTRVNQKSDSEKLFLSCFKNKILTRRAVERLVTRAAKQAGITRDICPHSFRHSFIHRMAKLRVPDAIIAQLVGHSTPHTIAHYTKLSRPDLEEFARQQFPVAA